MPRKKTERICEICGKPFLYTSHLRYVCSEECLAKRREIKLKEHNDKRRIGRHNKKPFHLEPKTDNMTALEQDVIRAAEQGLSYGYYSINNRGNNE